MTGLPSPSRMSIKIDAVACDAREPSCASSKCSIEAVNPSTWARARDDAEPRRELDRTLAHLRDDRLVVRRARPPACDLARAAHIERRNVGDQAAPPLACGGL